MIRGRVNVYGQPIVTVDIQLKNGDYETFDIKLDTGFNGELGLPSRLLNDLHTTLDDEYSTRLADGNIQQRQGYLVETLIGDETRTLLALDMGSGGPLLGTTALPALEARNEFLVNGDVTIAPINDR